MLCLRPAQVAAGHEAERARRGEHATMCGVHGTRKTGTAHDMLDAIWRSIGYMKVTGRSRATSSRQPPTKRAHTKRGHLDPSRRDALSSDRGEQRLPELAHKPGTPWRGPASEQHTRKFVHDQSTRKDRRTSADARERRLSLKLIAEVERRCVRADDLSQQFDGTP